MTSPSPRFLVYTFLAMGRQTRFHMLPEDCRRFLLFLQERDPVANGRDGYTLGTVLEVKKEIRVTGLFPEILPVNPYSPQQMSSTG